MTTNAKDDTQFDVWLRVKPYIRIGQKQRPSLKERLDISRSPTRSPSPKPSTPLKSSNMMEKSSTSRSKSPFYKNAGGGMSSKLKFEQAELNKADFKALSVAGTIITIDQQDKSVSPIVTKRAKQRSQQIAFPNIIHDTAKNVDLFEKVIKRKVDECLRGGSFTMMTYGNSGSGKSHTIFGKSNTDPGALLLAGKQLFKSIPEMQLEGRLVQIDLSFIEIYNEKAYDLLSPDRRNLAVLDSQFTDGIVMPDLIIKPLSSFDDFRDTVMKAQARRIISPNMNNLHSSRSHIVIELAISVTDKKMPDSRLVSRMKFVDLAGSEKVKNSLIRSTLMRKILLMKALILTSLCLL